jgi:hypothetical protein
MSKPMTKREPKQANKRLAQIKDGLAIMMAFVAFVGLVAALLSLAALTGLLSPRTVESAAAQSAYTQLVYEDFQDRTERLLSERGLPEDLTVPAFDETAFYRDSANSLKAALDGELRLADTSEGESQATDALAAYLAVKGVPLTPELKESIRETAALVAGTYQAETSFEFGLAWHKVSANLNGIAKTLLPAAAALAILAAAALLALLPNRREALRYVSYALIPAGPALWGLGLWLWTLVRPESLSDSYAYQQFAGRFLELALIPVLGLGALALAAGAGLAFLTRPVKKEAR